MKKAVLYDHLLRDLLAHEESPSLKRLLRTHFPCTTNMFVLRLCKSVVLANGGQLTGSWSKEQRIALGTTLVTVPSSIEIVPMKTIAMRMAEISDSQRVSTLGAEAVAAAEHLGAVLVVWTGDDGLRIRTAANTVRVPYRTLQR